MNLAGLRNRIARAGGAIPRDLPDAGATTEAVDLALAAGLVLAELESWAQQRPCYAPMSAPTVLHKPDQGDLALARNCPMLADALAKPCLIHAPGVLDARLAQLLARYQAAGAADESIEAALADVRERLTALDATGAHIPQWLARFLNPIAGNSAG